MEDQKTASHTAAVKAEEMRRPVFDPTGKLETMHKDETKVADIRRHIVGLVLVYVEAIVGLGLALFLIIMLLPGTLDTIGINQAAAASLFGLFSLIIISLGALFLVVATRLYKSNQLIVTEEGVTQVNQVGIFNRKVSELSMADIEDVTSEQKGIIHTVFNVGNLRVETSGEQNNFVFSYCPNPSAQARAILETRNAYIKKHSQRMHLNS